MLRYRQLPLAGRGRASGRAEMRAVRGESAARERQKECGQQERTWETHRMSPLQRRASIAPAVICSGDCRWMLTVSVP